MNITKIPPSELEVMKIIWNSDEAVSQEDFIDTIIEKYANILRNNIIVVIQNVFTIVLKI